MCQLCFCFYSLTFYAFHICLKSQLLTYTRVGDCLSYAIASDLQLTNRANISEQISLLIFQANQGVHWAPCVACSSPNIYICIDFLDGL